MHPSPAGLDLLATPPPDPGEAAVAEALLRHYGLAARTAPLPGERDRNLLVEAADGTRAVLKIHNPAEPPEERALGRAVLLHLEAARLPFAAPRLLRTRDGAESCAVEGHEATLATFVPGAPWDAQPPGPGPRRAVGEAAATLGLALEGFDPPAARRELPWDLMRLDRFSSVAASLPDRRRGDRLAGFLDRFVAEVRPAAKTLPAGAIHNDLNGGNVLFGGGRVAGVIDFGDLLRGPRVADLAVAATYGLGDGADLAEGAADVAEGWMRAAPLGPDEAGALFDLALARLALRVSIYAWRAARAPAGPLPRHAAAAGRTLDAAMALPPGGGRDRVMRRWRDARRRVAAGGGTARQ